MSAELGNPDITKLLLKHEGIKTEIKDEIIFYFQIQFQIEN